MFLDEIANTSLDLQAKLLRVLQEGEIRRVGENEVRKVDVRILAATNVDLQQAVEDGNFREDLFYRLNVVMIRVPSLRERREDIPLLAGHFLESSCERLGREVRGFTDDALRYLIGSQWPGNVRELENLVERAVILTDSDRLDAPFLRTLVDPAVTEGGPEPAQLRLPADAVFQGTLAAFDAKCRAEERRYLETLVEAAQGNISEAARRAEVRNRNTLVSRLKKHGLLREKR